ncbi:hypothetical protein ABIB40_000620 [Pedobacter sp. UYP30]|uniref:hypothetical protein n=1 Tax=Pedobacter sp. UYP30 TaxID=1756400 RepID=UPI00339B4257
MTTLIIEIKNKDTSLVEDFLSSIGAKITVAQSSQITSEIVQALSEIKEMREGKREPLSLNHI